MSVESAEDDVEMCGKEIRGPAYKVIWRILIGARWLPLTGRVQCDCIRTRVGPTVIWPRHGSVGVHLNEPLIVGPYDPLMGGARQGGLWLY